MRRPAFAADLLARRAAGERVGLLLVGVHDWRFGDFWAGRPNVARVVVPPDALPHALDWSCAVALDVLVGGACAPAVFYATATMLAPRAASLWGGFDDGFWRLERATGRAGWPFVAVDGPVPTEKFPAKLKIYRECALLLSDGGYAAPVFDAARVALRNHFLEDVT